MNCKSDPGKLGSLSVSSYSPYSMMAIHYVPLGSPNSLCPSGVSLWGPPDSGRDLLTRPASEPLALRASGGVHGSAAASGEERGIIAPRSNRPVW